jgi:hypothetical protein
MEVYNILKVFLTEEVTKLNIIMGVGAGTAMRDGSAKMMWLHAAPAPRHFHMCHCAFKFF